ncbi:MAG: GIY-YIG nuclease family protein [Methanobrevibacter sp.]|nr:GIY-YIG nuclease family protein [Methanobrevibacter sp.]
MTYIYAHFFSNGDKYVGISNNPEQRWKEGFDSNNTRQYNHKVLIANEKWERVSLVISEDLPRRIAETMESILLNGFDDFNLNIKYEVIPNLYGNEVICVYSENFSHVYPRIDGEDLFYSPEIEADNNYRLELIERKIEKFEREKERKESLEKSEREKERKEREKKWEEEIKEIEKKWEEERKREKIELKAKQRGISVKEFEERIKKIEEADRRMKGRYL